MAHSTFFSNLERVLQIPVLDLRADLTGVHLGGVNLHFANPSNANLQDAKLGYLPVVFDFDKPGKPASRSITETISTFDSIVKSCTIRLQLISLTC